MFLSLEMVIPLHFKTIRDAKPYGDDIIVKKECGTRTKEIRNAFTKIEKILLKEKTVRWQRHQWQGQTDRQDDRHHAKLLWSCYKTK